MLITMFQQMPSDFFYANFSQNKEKADERWTTWYGSIRAGPFNKGLGCFADTFQQSTCNLIPTPL